jgi:hypothetical protein
MGKRQRPQRETFAQIQARARAESTTVPVEPRRPAPNEVSLDYVTSLEDSIKKISRQVGPAENRRPFVDHEDTYKPVSDALRGFRTGYSVTPENALQEKYLIAFVHGIKDGLQFIVHAPRTDTKKVKGGTQEERVSEKNVLSEFIQNNEYRSSLRQRLSYMSNLFTLTYAALEQKRTPARVQDQSCVYEAEHWNAWSTFESAYTQLIELEETIIERQRSIRQELKGVNEFVERKDKEKRNPKYHQLTRKLGIIRDSHKQQYDPLLRETIAAARIVLDKTNTVYQSGIKTLFKQTS